MHDTVDIVRELHERDIPIYGVTNWPRQVWPPQRLLPERADDYAFLDLFVDIWVSGEHKVRKPDPRSYRSALDRFGIRAQGAVFIDDLEVNVLAAEQLGMTGIHFVGAQALRRELARLNLL